MSIKKTKTTVDPLKTMFLNITSRFLLNQNRNHSTAPPGTLLLLLNIKRLEIRMTRMLLRYATTIRWLWG